MFDSILYTFPSFSSHLAPSSDIVHQAAFENGIVKIIDGEEYRLCENEQVAVEKLRKAAPPVEISEVQGPSQDFAAELLKRRKLEKTSNSAYYDCRFLVPTRTLDKRNIAGGVEQIIYSNKSFNQSPIFSN